MEQILDAACDVFSQVGYDAATTNAIATVAGTSIGSLYRFFPDKAAIFKALIDRYLDHTRQILTGIEVETDMPLPPEKYVGRVIEGWSQTLINNPGYCSVFMQLQGTSPDIEPLSIAVTHGLAELLAQVNERYWAQQAKQQKTPHPIAALVLIEAISSLLRLMLRQPPGDRPLVLAEIKRLCSAYLHQGQLSL